MIQRGYSGSRLVGIVLIALAFAAGVGSGVAADRVIARHTQPDRRVIQNMSDVIDQLGLVGEQRRQAQALIDREAPRSQQAMLELAGRLRSISDSVDAELRTILTPAQRRKLDALRHPPTFILKHEDSRGTITVDTVHPPVRH